MDLPVDASRTCYGVRRFYFPQTAKIVIGVLAALVVIINSLAMISVLKNYRRLRQRIYVFVISLAATHILAGVIFLSDVMNGLFIQKQQRSQDGDEVMYRSFADEAEKYIRLRAINNNILSQELFETFKAGVVILSVLNTALVAFALYKRTTSMGRHHEDFKHMSAAFAPDGHSFLPAFDTMMRVLSIGSPAAANGLSKNLGRPGGQMMSTGDNNSPPRRISTASRFSNSSPQRSSLSKEADAVLLEKSQDEPGSCTRKPQIVRSATENSGRKPHSAKQPKKRSGSMSRLMNTGRRLSQALRSRSTSGTQSYVGRHSYSVMSKSATGCSLSFIWSVFAVTCVLPIALRRAGNVNFACPETCIPVELSEMVAPNLNANLPPPTGYSQQNFLTTSSLETMTTQSRSGISNNKSEETITKRQKINKPTNEQGLDTVAPTNSSDEKGIQNNSANLMFERVPATGVGTCAPAGFRPFTNAAVQRYSTGTIGSAAIVSKLDAKESKTASIQRSATSTAISRCSLCSAAFFPLSKSHMLYMAVVIFTTWCWLIVSASRLLYLRKHSSNVFVRCSALWRFMFMTSLFFFVTVAPYAVWIMLDSTTPSSASKSQLWHTSRSTKTVSTENMYGSMVENSDNTSQTTIFEGPTNFSQIDDDVHYLYPIYGVIATCLLMVNFAVAPTMYLVRLLGFRRIISAL